MRPAALIIAMAVLSAASAYQLELSGYWSKFAAVQMGEFCLGKNASDIYIKLVLKTLRECDKASTEADFAQNIGSLESANWDKIFEGYASRLYPKSEFAPDNTERIASIKTGIGKLIKRFRCAMQRLNLTDSNNRINKDIIVEGYKSLGLSATLEADLIAGVDQCYALSQCLPQNQPDDSPIPVDVVLTKTFLNCERYMRNWACLKNYLKSDVKAGEFDFSGADGTLDFLPDDEARAAAIALANELVGGDDYGLYE